MVERGPRLDHRRIHVNSLAPPVNIADNSQVRGIAEGENWSAEQLG